jgi:asparagine synthase (glutamine-hydrolysing)
MCAICGIKLKTNAVSATDAARLCQKMSVSMRHRGPDDEGLYQDIDHGVFLGHQRLSIIDLSSTGQQPFFNEDRSIATVVNGEIYNYRELRNDLSSRGHQFRSECDIEVVPHLFEEKRDFWHKLRGMYAAAIYDSKSGGLLLSRDSLGIKPLYLFECPDFIAFASEIRAFEVLPHFHRDLDIGGIADFLLFGSIPAPKTHFKSVRSLEPGEVLSIGNSVTFHSHSTVPQWCADAAHTESAEPEAMKACLKDSVARHLISDAPIGIFLSGGIDSGTLAGLASEVSGGVHTLSVSIPGSELDESDYAKETAALYGTQHSVVNLDQTTLEKDLPVFFDHLDLPSIDGLNTFIVAKAARRSGLKVSLSGVGGDELFAGYNTFSLVPRLERFQRWANRGGSLGRKVAAKTLESVRNHSSGARFAEVLRWGPGDCRTAYLACRGLFVGRFLRELLAPDFEKFAYRAQERFMDETAWTTNNHLPSRLAVGGLEVTRYMRNQLLRDTDVMSMAHGLEVRTPFVDRNVVQTALSYLVHFKEGDGYPKWLMRQSLSLPLPDRVVRRPKQGFVFPWQQWLQGFVLKDFDRMLAQPSDWNLVLNIEKVRWWRQAFVSGWAHWSCFWALYVLMRMLSQNSAVRR